MKEKPRRLAGTSGRKAFEEIRSEKIMLKLITLSLLAMATLIYWVSYFIPMRLPVIPILFTGITIYYGIYFAVNYKRGVIEARAYLRGVDGEVAVAQFMEKELMPLGYRILNDIPGDHFNVDHAIVGPTGVFCLETKTQSKPLKGQTVIKYDGNQIIINGLNIGNKPIIQVTAGAKWLKDLIQKYTGRAVDVYPIIVYPGWYIDFQKRNTPVELLNETMAVMSIKRKPSRLKAEDIALITTSIEKHIETCSDQ